MEVGDAQGRERRRHHERPHRRRDGRRAEGRAARHGGAGRRPRSGAIPWHRGDGRCCEGIVVARLGSFSEHGRGHAGRMARRARHIRAVPLRDGQERGGEHRRGRYPRVHRDRTDRRGDASWRISADETIHARVRANSSSTITVYWLLLYTPNFLTTYGDWPE